MPLLLPETEIVEAAAVELPLNRSWPKELLALPVTARTAVPADELSLKFVVTKALLVLALVETVTSASPAEALLEKVRVPWLTRDWALVLPLVSTMPAPARVRLEELLRVMVKAFAPALNVMPAILKLVLDEKVRLRRLEAAVPNAAVSVVVSGRLLLLQLPAVFHTAELDPLQVRIVCA